MKFSTDAINEKFKEQGKRMTPQRRAVIEILTDNKHHPCAEDIAAQLQDTMPDVSLSTVYNILEDLSTMGFLTKIATPGPTRFDPDGGDHAHLYCRECGSLIDIPLAERDLVPLRAAASEAGTEIDSAVIEYRGICYDCVAQRSGDPACCAK